METGASVRVFLSWSGEKSRKIAEALNDWLPQVINEVEPYISVDIEAGARWQVDVAESLESTSFGLICVTRENQEKPWLNFEAGALAKSLDVSRVVPLVADMNLSELRMPLAQFQAKVLDRGGVWDVVKGLNGHIERPRSEGQLEEAFEVWYPKIESSLSRILSSRDSPSTFKVRTDRDLLEEVLGAVREVARHDSRQVLESESSDLLRVSTTVVNGLEVIYDIAAESHVSKKNKSISIVSEELAGDRAAQGFVMGALASEKNLVLALYRTVGDLADGITYASFRV